MNWIDVLRTAMFALRGNWMRSALTSLGVIIGIAAVIVMVSIGQGTQAEIDRQLAGLGAQKLDIGPNVTRTAGGVRVSASSFFTLNQGDIAAIRDDIPEVEYISGSLRGSSQVVYAEKNWNTSWQGVEADFPAINGWSIVNGQGLEAQQVSASERVALLGETVRRELFGDGSGIGEQIRIGRTLFTVIGTLGSKGLSGFGRDQDDLVLVPLTTARKRLMGPLGLPGGAVMDISLTVADARDLDYVQSEIESLLRQRHHIGPGQEDDFRVRNLTQLVAARNQTTQLMSWLLGAVATISLIVGGIGIMNIMLVSVTERVGEIGLRMAVGAAPQDIRRQFLTEAMLLSLGGGVIGIVIGIIGALLVGHYNAELPVRLNGQVIALAAGFSVATGLFFGYYPARKASQLDPIEALRQ